MPDISITPGSPPKPSNRTPWRDRLLSITGQPGQWFDVGPFAPSGSTISNARNAAAALGPGYEVAAETEANVLTIKIRYCPPGENSPPAAAVADAQEGQPGTSSSDAGATDRPDAGAPLPVSPAPITGTDSSWCAQYGYHSLSQPATAPAEDTPHP